MSNSEWNDPDANRLPEKVAELDCNEQLPHPTKRKRVVVVGLGMVGISFIEKLIKHDVKRREYDVIVIGEEQHLAYNRVGLTSFFQHRNVENLYLNPREWYSSMPDGSLNYHLNTLVTEIHQDQKIVTCSDGSTVPYDILVLATGSDALLPRHTPGHDAKGVFVYRTIEDLQKLIEYASTRKGTTGVVVGGGLLGLEAAKAMMDLEDFGKVKLIERNRWVLSRQLDADAGGMVVEQVRQLGLDVLLSKRVGRVNTDEQNNVVGVTFEDGEMLDCSCICFAIGIRARDELARKADIKCADRGGGIVIDNNLQTSTPDIYAVGECASWENSTFGLIAPGIDMADVLAFNLTQAKAHSPRTFQRPDLSTKLKLLGVEVASFGDFFADRDGPKDPPVVGRHAAKKAKEASGGSSTNGTTNERVKDLTDGPAPAPVKALTYKDPFLQVYKKYLFTLDGKYLLGGMMIGDTKDYIKLVPMVKKKKALDIPPSEFIIGASGKGEDDGSDLAEDTQICSCHNVLKRDLATSIKSGTCKSIGDVKSCTKAGTGCGGCMPLVQSIFNKEMSALGQEVKNHLCPHFNHSRSDLFNIVSVRKLDSFASIMRDCGTSPDSSGCEACKPAIGSILASLFNKHVLDAHNRGLQDTNDKFLANIQRNGTFSVIPRVSGGEITPDKLILIGSVAKKYSLYTKITGGQRIDMFGAKKHQLLSIWQELVDGGMESGHAYAKSLRTVKSCVGTTWCRFGIGDSVGMAVRLEERYKSIRSPHKIKGGVSGCVRECAEAQNKDFGLIATDKGFNVYVGGNGGASPRHAELLAKDVPPDDVIPLLDRYLAFYIRTADKLQRTARWIEGLDGGIGYLREVVLNDKLGICADLERQMGELVGSFFCEWTEVLGNPEKRRWFRRFANVDDDGGEGEGEGGEGARKLVGPPPGGEIEVGVEVKDKDKNKDDAGAEAETGLDHNDDKADARFQDGEKSTEDIAAEVAPPSYSSSSALRPNPSHSRTSSTSAASSTSTSSSASTSSSTNTTSTTTTTTTTTDPQEPIDLIPTRSQHHPAPWPTKPTTYPFSTHAWRSPLTWTRMLPVSALPASPTGSSVPILHGDTQLALFLVKGRYYASQQMCPHRRTWGLSEGLIGDNTNDNDDDGGGGGGSCRDDDASPTSANDEGKKTNNNPNPNPPPNQKIHISCPYHKRNFLLSGTSAGQCTNDSTLSIATFDARADDGYVWVKLPESRELDEVLGMGRWRVRAGEEEAERKKVVEGRGRGRKGRKVVVGKKEGEEDGGGRKGGQEEEGAEGEGEGEGEGRIDW